MSAIRALSDWRKGHKTKPCTKKDAPAFVFDSRASMHMPSKKDLSSEELETLRRSRTPTSEVTANGKVQTYEEAQVYVHDLDLFVFCALSKTRVQFYHLESSTKNTDIPLSGPAAENFVPLVDPELSSNSGTSSFSTSLPLHSSSTSSSPATERSDDQAPGKWHDSPKIKKKNRENNGASDDRLRDPLEWLQEFTENLEDTEVAPPARISHDSDSETPIKVVSGKHSIFAHLPKQKFANCARGPRSQGIIAENALVVLYFEQLKR